MPQTSICRGVATRIVADNNWTKVYYHSTCVIKWNAKMIVLDSGGWKTATTKLRMNQASNQFDLGIKVRQKNRKWFVYVSWPSDNNGFNMFEFEDHMIIDRNTATILGVECA